MSCENFNHLILLIGTNPLPNFVVADYFLQKNENIQNIWLIHSAPNDLQAGTNAQAENLEKLLRERWENKHQNLQFPMVKIPLSDVSHARSIQYEIREHIMEKLQNAGGVHLNYTGGTKSMSTHLYWILRDAEKVSKSFSYLDARNFRLIDDDRDELIADDLRKNIDLTVEELIALHGFERINKPGTADFSEAAKAFRELIENDQLLLFYENGGYDRNIFENKKKKGELAESKGQLDREKIDVFEPNDVFIKIFSLNHRNRLPEERRKAINEVKAKLVDTILNPLKKEESLNQLHEMKQGKSSYSMAVRAALDNPEKLLGKNIWRLVSS